MSAWPYVLVLLPASKPLSSAQLYGCSSDMGEMPGFSSSPSSLLGVEAPAFHAWCSFHLAGQQPCQQCFEHPHPWQTTQGGFKGGNSQSKHRGKEAKCTQILD